MFSWRCICRRRAFVSFQNSIFENAISRFTLNYETFSSFHLKKSFFNEDQDIPMWDLTKCRSIPVTRFSLPTLLPKETWTDRGWYCCALLKGMLWRQQWACVCLALHERKLVVKGKKLLFTTTVFNSNLDDEMRECKFPHVYSMCSPAIVVFSETLALVLAVLWNEICIRHRLEWWFAWTDG